MDSVNVDVEGDEDCDIMLRDIMQDNSNQSSPAESVASSNASKKRDKSGIVRGPLTGRGRARQNEVE